MSSPSPIVISLGGSLIVPSMGIDIAFLKLFHELLLEQVELGQRFILIGGGGWTARAYMNAAQALVSLEPEDMDWLGIHSCRLNGHLLRTIFRSVAHPVIVKDPRQKQAWHEPVLIGTGWAGCIHYAPFVLSVPMERISLSIFQISKGYSKDPKKHVDAVPFDHMS